MKISSSPSGSISARTINTNYDYDYDADIEFYKSLIKAAGYAFICYKIMDSTGIIDYLKNDAAIQKLNTKTFFS